MHQGIYYGGYQLFNSAQITVVKVNTFLISMTISSNLYKAQGGVQTALESKSVNLDYFQSENKNHFCMFKFIFLLICLAVLLFPEL